MSGPAPAPAVVPEAPTRARPALAPRWKVLLHNDDEHDMVYVVQSLRKAVPGLGLEEAVRIMLEAHLRGVGLVTVAPRESAEYYQERIQSFGLACTLEPDA